MFDRFQRKITYLRVSVTDRCNLRCVYCMPEAGVAHKRRADLLSYEEIEAVTRAAVELGVSKVRITGGEPLVRKGILSLVARLAVIPGIADFALTTNGVRLPRLASALREAGLHRVNISLDTLDPERFHAITRCGRLDETLAGIEAARAAGFHSVKLNCVIDTTPDEPDARAVADYGRQRGMEVRFIRRMNTGKGEFWPVIGGDGGRCGTCNRLRLSSDGRLYSCLFNDRSFSVRELGARGAILAAVDAKPAAGLRSDNQFYSLGG